MSAPRLLFDENLSPRLAKALADCFPDSTHVDQVGLQGRPDEEIWALAGSHGYMLVSKDNDFRQLSFLRGAPPKVVWLRVGNSPTREMEKLLRDHRADLEVFALDADTALLVLQIDPAIAD
jgi:predicted nuclease of predicted toxin-antitoxin system